MAETPSEINKIQTKVPIISNLYYSSSAFVLKKNSFENATKSIIIENQYIQHEELCRVIINSCLKHNIKLTIIYNNDFAMNP